MQDGIGKKSPSPIRSQESGEAGEADRSTAAAAQPLMTRQILQEPMPVGLMRTGKYFEKQFFETQKKRPGVMAADGVLCVPIHNNNLQHMTRLLRLIAQRSL
jgi:hypothetical protein